MSKFVKISEETATRIRNLLQGMKTAKEGEEEPYDSGKRRFMSPKEVRARLAAWMAENDFPVSDKGKLKIAEMLSEHAGFLKEEQKEPAPDFKDEATKLASYMAENGLINASDKEKIAEKLSTHEGALLIAQRGVQLQVKNSATKSASAKEIPPVGAVRRYQTKEAEKKDPLAEADKRFEEAVLGQS